jgi:uncharacterized protein (DUF2147 family)
MARLALISVALLLAAARAAPAVESPVGLWNTVDDKTGKVRSTVEVYEQGGKIFGRIVSLVEPNDDEGKPKRCTKCTGPDKDRPLVGLVIIKDLAADADRYKGGTIMDPENGKVYRAEIWVEGATLKVRGYLAFFYRTQTWLKSK